MHLFQAREENKSLEVNIQDLQSNNQKLQDIIEVLIKEKNNLETNISSLYLTAKIEIERKEKIIADLRMELDDLKFRRVGKRKHDNSDYQRPLKMAKTDDCEIQEQTCFDSNLRNDSGLNRYERVNER